jgi:HK97 family phage major capsid protein
MRLLVIRAFGDYTPDQIVENLPDDIAADLIKGGYCQEVQESEEAEAPAEEAPAEETPVAEKSITQSNVNVKELVEKKLEKIAEETIKKSLKTMNRPNLSYATPVEKNAGVQNFADWLGLITKSHRSDSAGTRARNRLEAFNKSPAGNNSLTGSAGGFLVPQIWNDILFTKSFEEGSLMQYCDVSDLTGLDTDTKHYEIMNDTSRRDSFRPVQSYLVQQGAAPTESDPVFGEEVATLRTIGIKNTVTNELLSDNAYKYNEQLLTQFGREIAFSFNSHLFTGTGLASGGPGSAIVPGPGILNASMTLQIDRTTDGTVEYPDLLEAWASMPTAYKKDAIWIGNQTVTPYIDRLAFDPTSDTKIPAYGLVSYGGAGEDFVMKIKGRGYVECEHAKEIGTFGDLVLTNLKESFVVIHKAMEILVNPYTLMDSRQTYFVCFIRYDIKPKWIDKVQMLNSDKYFSPCIGFATGGSS